MYEYQNWMTTKEKSYLLFTISKLELQTKLDTISCYEQSKVILISQWYSWMENILVDHFSYMK